jgi:predicted polyphosphate/ATP-dependent NAD kinase
VQGLAGRDHRVNVLAADEALHDDRPRAVVLQEFLHHSGKVFEVGAPEALGAHRFRELDKVWVMHSGVRVAVLIEEV